MAKNIGATLSLNNGNFFTNMKSAITASNNLKNSLNGTGQATTAFGDKLQSVSGKAASMAKGITIAGTAAATAVGAMVTKSVASFAEYEQLIGGVETLFKDSAEAVKGYANEAYKNAGLSANEYMSTVTSFSASLINSMGGDTEAAATRANMAINDMSDNANKMGTNMDSIMQTYQSISRGNYGMLDNLKLGYGGTKKEMERLIADAERMRAEMGKPIDYDISSFSDVVSAIHDIQTRMGITGTTSKEAATTISGSLNMLKASWNNTLTVLTVGGDMFDTSIENLVTSAMTFGKNIVPAIEKALGGIGQLVTRLAPVIAAELPNMVSTVLPSLVSAAGSLVSGVASQIPAIAGAVLSSVPAVLDGMAGMLGESSVGKLKSAFDNLKNSISNALSGIDTSVISNLANGIIPALCGALSIAMNTASGLITVIDVLSPVIAGVAGAVTTYKIAVTAANVVEGIRNGLIAFSATMTGTQAAAFAPLTTATIAQIAATQALNIVSGVFGAIMTFITSPIGLVIIAIGALIAIGVLLWQNWDSVCAWCKTAFQSVSDFFVSVGTGIVSFFTGLWSGISSTVSSVWSGITGFLSGAWNTISSAATSVFTSMGTAISNVWNGIVNTVKGAINGIISGINSMIRGAVSGINALINGVNTVTGAVGIPAIPTFTAPQIPLLAKGGNIQTSGAVIVGEKGPEMLELPKGARVTPLSKTTNNYTTANAVSMNVALVFDDVKSVLSNTINLIKGFFSFNQELPKIKLPHFNINSSSSLNPSSAPSFGVEWYKKGGIMTRPTMLGMNGTNAMVGGEAGAEAILPLTQFWNNLRDYLKPQPVSNRPNVTNHIEVKVYTDREDDETLADKVAKRIVESLENM